MTLDPALSWTPPVPTFVSRLARLRDAAGAAGVDAVVVSPGADLLYLLGHDKGSHERLTALVVPAHGDPFVVVPKLERPGWDGTGAEASGIEFRTWSDGEDPYELIADALPHRARLAVDDHLPAMHTLALQAATDGGLTLAGRLIGEQRAHKDADETRALAAVGAANDRVQARMREWLRPGRTEAEVAEDITRALIEEGHSRADFVIVASGPNGASPHHTASSRVIEVGDPVVVDIGGPAASGYNSDSTRTYCLGAPDPEFIRVHDVVRQAQDAGVRAAREGATCESVDAAARSVIEEAGYGKFFITRTGHGLGLEVHEEPYLVRGNREVLAPGHVFSVEPGVYLPGRFGVRIEDIVVIGDEGSAIRLNDSPRDWRLG